MSLPDFSRHQSLFTVPNLLAGQFHACDRFRLFAEKVYPLLVEARPALSRCYCANNGRAAVEPVVLLGISLLQFMERVPDRLAMELVEYHLGWKLALGLGLEIAAPDPSSLVHFRQRLLDHQEAKLVFDAILKGLREAGLIPRIGKQRLDSTHVLGAVAQLSALECVRETLRLALVDLGDRKDLDRPPQWDLLWERYVSSKTDTRLEQAALDAKYLQAGHDAAQLLDWVREQSLDNNKQVLLLQRVWQEHYERVDGTLQRRRRPGGAVQNPHDPEAQWSSKGKTGKAGWVGYKAQVAETVIPNDPPASDTLQSPHGKGKGKRKTEPTRSFVTALETQPATASDEAGMGQVLEAQDQSGLQPPGELYVDSAYVSARKLKDAHEQHRQLMGPALGSSRQNPGFETEDFNVDVQARQAVCPAGHANTRCTRATDKSRGTSSFRFEWTGLCRDCPHRGPCAKGKDRHLEVGEHHQYLQQRRREQKTEEFAKRMHQRNGIESTISELTRAHGLRQARYRGLPKVRLQNYFIGAACNAKRYLRLLIYHFGQALPRGAPQPAGLLATGV